jgi:hypothetical protein
MLADIGDELPRYVILQRLYKNHEALLAGLASIYLEVMRFCVATKDLLVRARKHRSTSVVILQGEAKTVTQFHCRLFPVYGRHIIEFSMIV